MLSDKECRNLKPKDKTYCVSDEKSLYMEVHPNGSKYWMWKYRYASKQKRIALVVYPEVSLKDAREKREEMRKILKAGEDPAELRKKKKIEVRENTVNTFENIAREWFEKKKHTLAERYGTQLLGRLEADIFPFLGSTPIKNITSKELLIVIRKIEERGATESAHRILQTVGQVFEYAIADDRAEGPFNTEVHQVAT
ncbi:hypothetical protein FACS1894122_12680 [Alphaproteobacteria bacterium]|nr:hypothetical protein FACS1894122_12680 [Alphaproteobacteria bacterium]